MTDDRIDFAPLDPSRDTVAFERRVRAVADAAAPALARRRAARTALGQVGRWRRPVLAAAAVLALAAVTTLFRLPDAATPATTDPGLAEAVGIPTVLAAWVAADERPTAADLLSISGERP